MEKEKKKTIDKKIVNKARKEQREFLKFLRGYKVIQLAVAVAIGNAAKDLVSSIASNLIMPLVALLTPTGTWREWVVRVATSEFRVGEFLSSLLDFLIVALVVFLVIKKLFRIETKKK